MCASEDVRNKGLIVLRLLLLLWKTPMLATQSESAKDQEHYKEPRHSVMDQCTKQCGCVQIHR